MTGYAYAEWIVGQLASFGITVVAATGLASLIVKVTLTEKIKAAIKSDYDAKLETLKHELKSKSVIEIEKLKSELNIATIEMQVRYSGLYEMRVKAVAELYAALRHAIFNLEVYTNLMQPDNSPEARKERAQAAYDANKNFATLYREKRIFLPKHIAEKADHIEGELRANFNIFYSMTDNRNDRADLKKWLEIYKNLQALSKPVLAELEEDLRAVLGDDLFVAPSTGGRMQVLTDSV